MENHQKYWDAIANHVAKYDARWFSSGFIGNETWFNEYNRRRIIKAIFSAIPNKKYNSILDVGCGVGQWTTLLATKLGAEVTGFDLSPKMIELARKRSTMLKVQNVKFQVMNVADMSFENGSFDLVNCVTVLQHIPDKQLWEKAIKEIVRVTKPGGFVLLLEAAPKKFRGQRKRGDLYTHLEREYVEEFEKTGTFFIGERKVSNALSLLILRFGEGLLYLHAKTIGKKRLNFYSAEASGYKPKSMYPSYMFTIVLAQLMEKFPLFKKLDGEKILLFQKSKHH